MSFEKALTEGKRLIEQGDYGAALESLEKARNLALIEGAESWAHGESLSWLGHILVLRGDYAEALEHLEKALELAGEHKGRNSVETATILRRLGNARAGLEQFEEGKQNLEEALSIFKDVLGPYNTEVADTLCDLGTCLVTSQDLDRAGDCLTKAYGMRRKLLGDEHPDLIRSLSDLSVFYSVSGNNASARAFSRKAVSLGDSILPEDHPLLGIACFNLTNQYLKDRRFEAGKPSGQRARTILEKKLGDLHELRIMTLEFLGTIAMSMSESDEAEELLKQALVMSQAKWGREDPHILPSLIALGTAYLKSNDYKNAELYLKMSLAVLQHARDFDVSLEYRLIDQLSISYFWQGKIGDAALLVPSAYRAKHTSDFTMLMDALHKLAGFVSKQLEKDQTGAGRH
ncbi:MAG: tetratricopeptide repeat protein [Candidatus Obscuribacterales bacterium]